MELLLIFIAASLMGAGLVVWVMLWSTNRAADAAITRYFRDSEHILDTGKAPPSWHVIPWWKRLFARYSRGATQEDVLGRLDDMIRFFEHCSFVEDEWTREQLLAQLDEVRVRWRRGGAS